MKQEMKTPRGISESSTTSDNTTEFIDIVKKYDIVYNTHNPDYKNAEVKLKIWSQIADEIGLSVDASKRKWKNLRDSYTKYLRSFRTGTKTSKKYQYWAHADHMDFLKPYQGPGRNTNNQDKKNATNEEEDTECDLGFQVLAKASTTSSEEDLKIPLSVNNVSNIPTTPCSTAIQAIATIPPTLNSTTTTAATSSASASINMNTPLALTSNATTTATLTSLTAAQAAAAALALLPLPALPTVQLPPPLPAKHQQLISALAAAPLSTSVFPIPQLASNGKSQHTLPMPTVTSGASNVGCLIIEPQLFVDSFKKELTAPTLGLVNSFTSQTTGTAPSSRINPPLISKIRRVQPSPQTGALNLSFSANNSSSSSSSQPPPAKTRKVQSERSGDVDVAAILQANRDLDANTLFFLSLARTVRAMPTKFQSLAKMRCMRIVSDIELELDNIDDDNGGMGNGNMKYGADSPSPPAPNATQNINGGGGGGEAGTEHFVYVMSPSRVESMIDLSSDEDATNNVG